MPEQVDPIPYVPRTRWAKYADGKAWKFVHGDDYDCATAKFRKAAYVWALRHDYVLHAVTDLTDKGAEYVIIQFIPKDQEADS